MAVLFMQIFLISLGLGIFIREIYLIRNSRVSEISRLSIFFSMISMGVYAVVISDVRIIIPAIIYIFILDIAIIVADKYMDIEDIKKKERKASLNLKSQGRIINETREKIK